MTLIGRKILLTNTDASGNPTLDFPITTIECVEGGASQEDLDTTNNALTENTTNLQNQINNLTNELTFLGSNMAYALQVVEYVPGSHILLSNGLQVVVKKEATKAGNSSRTYTFPKPFLSSPIMFFSDSDVSLKSDPTTTQFSVSYNYESCSAFNYIAVGQGAVVL